MTDDLYCSTDGCGDFENNVSKILVDISQLQNKDIDQDARLEALELLDISAVITVSNNALLVANAIDAKATLALSTASTADGKVNGAVSNAANAVIAAGDALTDSATALNKAIEAYNAAVGAVAVAGYADAKAVSALSASGTAVSRANAAVITANAADGKADIAVYDSNVAVVKVNKAIITDAQTLTTGQKAQARANIDAVGKVGNETVGGVKNFISSPLFPTYSMGAARKNWAVNFEQIIHIASQIIAPQSFINDLTMTSYVAKCFGVGDRAFSGAANLTSCVLQDAMFIGNHAFFNTPKLVMDVKTPATYMGYSTFEGSGIKSIDLSYNFVMSSRVFTNASRLVMVVLRGSNIQSLPSINTFEGTPIADSLGYIYVPDALYDAYLIATNWATYASQIKKISELNE